MNIHDLKLFPLKVHKDDRGMLLHMLRKSDNHFKAMGEIYFSITNPKIIKGWKKHLKMTQNFVVPVGEIQIVLFDERPNSPSFGAIDKVILSVENYKLLIIPFGIWYSFKTLSSCPAMIANCATIEHEATEVITKDILTNEIPYRWHKE